MGWLGVVRRVAGRSPDGAGDVDLAGIFVAPSDPDASGFEFVVDEDDMASNSATKVPTQQSVKAYSDTSPGAIIALLAYDPVSETTYTTGDSTVADLDATNLAITFTTPPSGNVIVELTAAAEAAANNRCHWALREGTTTVDKQLVWRAANSTPYARITARFILTGLSPGSHTYKWAGASGTTDDFYTIGGADVGPFEMRVVVAPF